MKRYVAPLCEVLVLTSDVLMASNENELVVDTLSDVFVVENIQ